MTEKGKQILIDKEGRFFQAPLGAKLNIESARLVSIARERDLKDVSVLQRKIQKLNNQLKSLKSVKAVGKAQKEVLKRISLTSKKLSDLTKKQGDILFGRTKESKRKRIEPEKVLLGAAALAALGVASGALAFTRLVVSPVKFTKEQINALRPKNISLTVRGLKQQWRINPIGMVAEFITFSKLLGLSGRLITRSPVGQFVRRELFIKAQPKELQPFIRSILKSSRVQAKINPFNVKTIKKVDFMEIKTLTKIEANALAKTVADTNSTLFGTIATRTLGRKRTPIPKDVDIATSNVKAFSRQFLKELPVKLRKNYNINAKGKLIRKADGNRLYDIKSIDRLIPQRSLLTRKGLLPISGFVKFIGRPKRTLIPKIGKKVSQVATEIPTQRIIKVGGIKLVGFGEQTVRKALGTIEVLIRKNVRRAKDPQGFVINLKVQLDALKRLKPKTLVGKLRNKSRIKTLTNTIRLLTSKSFLKILESKIPSINQKFPLLSKISVPKLKNINKKTINVVVKKLIKSKRAGVTLGKPKITLKKPKVEGISIKAKPGGGFKFVKAVKPEDLRVVPRPGGGFKLVRPQDLPKKFTVPTGARLRLKKSFNTLTKKIKRKKQKAIKEPVITLKGKPTKSLEGITIAPRPGGGFRFVRATKPNDIRVIPRPGGGFKLVKPKDLPKRFTIKPGEFQRQSLIKFQKKVKQLRSKAKIKKKESKGTKLPSNFRDSFKIVKATRPEDLRLIPNGKGGFRLVNPKNFPRQFGGEIAKPVTGLTAVKKVGGGFRFVKATKPTDFRVIPKKGGGFRLVDPKKFPTLFGAEFPKPVSGLTLKRITVKVKKVRIKPKRVKRIITRKKKIIKDVLVKSKIQKRIIQRISKLPPSKLPSNFSRLTTRLKSILANRLPASQISKIPPIFFKDLSQLPLKSNFYTHLTPSQLSKFPITRSNLPSIPVSALSKIPPGGSNNILSRVPQSRLPAKITSSALSKLPIPKSLKTKILKLPRQDEEEIIKKLVRKGLLIRKFKFTPDFFSTFFGIRANAKQAKVLLRKNRVFTGVERRQLISPKIVKLINLRLKNVARLKRLGKKRIKR